MLLVCIVALFGLIYVKSPIKEGYEDIYGSKLETILTEPAEKKVLDIEGKRCLHTVTTADSANKIDILNNYRLLNHPTDDNSCYLKMNDTLVANKCSKFNENLYDKEFTGVVDKIQSEKINDPYISETLTDNVCSIKFKPGSSTIDKEKYVKYIDNNDPKVNKLEADIAKSVAINEVLKKTLSDRKATVKKLKDEVIPERDQTIANNNAKIEAKLAPLRTLDDKIKEREIAYKELPQKLYDRDYNSKVYVNTPYVNNVPLRIGEYDTEVLEWHSIGNDRSTAVNVPKDVKATVYSAKGYQGYSKTLTGPTQVNLQSVKYEGTDVPIYDTKRSIWNWMWASAHGNNVSSVRVEPNRMYSKYYP
jgi:hypothetical protein